MAEDFDKDRSLPKVSKGGWVLVTLVVIVALMPGVTAIITIVLDPKEHTAFALAYLSTAFPLIFVLFDWLVLRGEQRTQKDKNEEKREYYPNFRIWGAGFILGISVNVGYLFSRVILSSLAQSSVKHQAISNFSDHTLTFSDPFAREEVIGHLSSDTHCGTISRCCWLLPLL
jgi:hypothetical protein